MSDAAAGQARQEVTRATPVGATRANPASWPWWIQTLVLWGVGRAVSAVVLVGVAATQAATPWTEASPGYPEYVGLMWDGSWYRTIAESGYPAGLPLGPDGRVQQNAWAFFPLFPMLARALMAGTGAPWHVVAPALALVLGAAAALVVHRLLSSVAGLPRWLPLAGVAVLAAAPASPVLQVAYTESLALLLIAGVLLCLVRRRYLTAVPLVLALGLTRAVALPIAVAVLAHGWSRLRAARAGRPDGGADDLARVDGDVDDRAGVAGDVDDPAGVDGDVVPVRELVRIGVLAATAGVSGLLWPAVCAVVTGEPTGYTLTQAAWRGRGAVVPVLPWLDVSRWLMGDAGLLVLAAAVGLAVLLVASGPLRALGPEMRGWTAGYLGYLLLVVEPGTSLVRFLLLAFPIGAVAALLALRSRWPRLALGTLLVLGLVGQVAWVGLLWRLVPPSGWPP